MPAAIFGYVSVPHGLPDRQVRAWYRDLEAFATLHGYVLAGIFQDVRGTGETGFYAMLTALRHEGAVAVAVPALEHLQAVAGLDGADLRAVRRYLRARVLVAPPTGRDTGSIRVRHE